MSAHVKKTILLVEDESLIALAEAQTIKGFGYTVITAHSGEQAVEIAVGEKQPDLILMDIDLGKGISGSEAAAKIFSQRPLPIVFLTSHAERDMVDKVRGITRYGYVIKNSGDFVLQSSIEMAFELFEAHNRAMEELAERRRTEVALMSAQEAIEASECAKSDLVTKLNEAQKTAKIGSWDWDMVSNNVWWSEELFRIFELNAESFTPSVEANAQYVHPEDRAPYHAEVARVIQAKEELNVDLRIIAANGALKYCNSRARLALDAEGHPIRCYGTFADVTGSKRAEEAGRKLEQQFRLVWESSAAGMRLTNDDGINLRVNDAFCRMVGKERSELEGNSLAVIYDKDRQAHVSRRHQERFRSRTVETHFEREVILWNGRRLWIEVSNSFLEFAGQPSLLLGIFHDITERKRAEQRFNDERNLLSSSH